MKFKYKFSFRLVFSSPSHLTHELERQNEKWVCPCVCMCMCYISVSRIIEMVKYILSTDTIK